MADKYLIALGYIPELGPSSIKKLLSAFGSAKEIFAATAKELDSVEKLTERKKLALLGFKLWDKVGSDMSMLAEKGIKVVAMGEKGYPEALKELPDAPPLLYMRGDVLKEDRYAVAVVGTRTPTPYGLNEADKISTGLARMGFTIVSGMARGVDTAAHMGAIKSGGRSIAVTGTGIDVNYPAENRVLADKLSQCGCVMTEFPPGTPPNRENFPRRNRIISGLSLGVLVVEAAKDSGSLITANCALEQGKEVFSVPGNINSMASRGTNELIRKGARMVTCAEDVLEELTPVLKGFLKARKKAGGKQMPPLTAEESSLLQSLGPEPRHVDDISREQRLPASAILAVLLGLELKGVVRQAAGKRFFIC
jgi:DNA processing protein